MIHLSSARGWCGEGNWRDGLVVVVVSFQENHNRYTKGRGLRVKQMCQASLFLPSLRLYPYHNVNCGEREEFRALQHKKGKLNIFFFAGTGALS